MLNQIGAQIIWLSLIRLDRGRYEMPIIDSLQLKVGALVWGSMLSTFHLYLWHVSST